MSALHTPQLLLQKSDALSSACRATRLQLDAFVDGEATALTHDAVTAHLARCGRCRHAEQALRELLSAVGRTHLTVVASRRLRLRVALLFAEQQRVLS